MLDVLTTTAAASVSAAASLPPLHHVGWIVRDCVETTRQLAAMTGQPSMEPFEDAYTEVLVDGRRQPFSVLLSFVSLGGVLVELLEPLDDNSPHAAFLANKGGGLHHLGFRVPDIQAQLERLEGLGLRRLVDATISPTASHWAFLGTELDGGDVIELMGDSPQGERFFSRVHEALRFVERD